MFLLLGKGLPILSKVFRPITTVWRAVVSRKCFMSAGICQSKVLPLPSSLFLPIAAMSEIISYTAIGIDIRG